MDKNVVPIRARAIPLFASLAIGSTGTLILGLQPVLLGALLGESRVTFNGLALIATVEMLAIGLGSVLLALLFTARHMRIKAAGLLVIAAACHFLTAYALGLSALTAARLVAGLAEGGLIAVAVEFIARTRAPGRNGGWFVSMQTILQSVLAAILALAVIPTWGSAGGFVLLGVVSLVGLAIIPALDDDYGPMPEAEQQTDRVATWLKPAAAVLCIFTLYLFIGAIWAYLEPLGAQSGVDGPSVGLIVSLSLLVQVIGALAATALEPHIRYPTVIGGGAAAAMLIAIGFASGPGPVLFWFLSLAIGFLWLFVVPWQISMTLAADPSRKTALLVPAAQLFGAAIGPAGASVFISETDFHPAAWFAAVAAGFSLAFLLLLLVLDRRTSDGR